MVWAYICLDVLTPLAYLDEGHLLLNNRVENDRRISDDDRNADANMGDDFKGLSESTDSCFCC